MRNRPLRMFATPGTGKTCVIVPEANDPQKFQEALLRTRWQRLVSHDCLACGVDLDDCAEYLALNAAVNEAAEGLSRWRQWRVFRSLDLPRTTWRYQRRKWA